MKSNKKIEKEQYILSAGERIFATVGYENAKMDDIAKEASITKVTLYKYFKSKENLYFGITYRALQTLNERYIECISKHNSESGMIAVLALQRLFIEFCENNYLYSEALLNYFSVIRSSARGKDVSKLTKGIQESAYFKKLQKIHNLPFKLIALEIIRGQKDGSIKTELDPMLSTLYAWSNSIGYIKLVSSTDSSDTFFMNIAITDIKEMLYVNTKNILAL